MTNLKPCPFCGGEATLHPFFSGRYMAVCKKCSVNMPIRDTYEEAIAAWNNRAAYEAEDYFFLPKPKEKIIHVAPLGVEETENGYKGQFGIRVLEEAARRWANEIDDEIVRRISECWNAKNCDECERGAIPATEENMREHGWVRERTCQNRDAKIYPGGMVFVCSVCESMSTDGQPNYCPKCGAKVVD